MIHSRTLTAAGVKLHYLECGEGVPVLLLHGWPTNAQLYRHVLPALAAAGRRAIALDLPGFGASDKPEASYSFRFHERVLTALLDGLGIERTGLVVHDLGGPIGLYWALNHQDRLEDVVLLNTIVFPQMSPMVKAFVAATLLPGVRSVLASPWGIRRSMRFGVVDKARITPEVAALYTRPFPDRASRRVLLKTAHALSMKGFAELEARIGELEVPVHLIYGEADRILPQVARTMARVAEAIPHATVEAIPRCGHFLQEDRPDELAALLAERLAR